MGSNNLWTVLAAGAAGVTMGVVGVNVMPDCGSCSSTSEPQAVSVVSSTAGGDSCCAGVSTASTLVTLAETSECSSTCCASKQAEGTVSTVAMSDEKASCSSSCSSSCASKQAEGTVSTVAMSDEKAACSSSCSSSCASKAEGTCCASKSDATVSTVAQESAGTKPCCALMAGMQQAEAAQDEGQVVLASLTQPEMSPEEMQAEYEAWMEAAQPTDHHKALKKMVGNFSVESTAWFGPMPEKTTATSTNTLVLGGRYLHTEYRGSVANQPFNGIGYLGWDNLAENYVGIWMDDMSTQILKDAGPEMDGKTMTTHGTQMAPGGIVMKSRTAYEFISNDRYTMTMYHTAPGAEEQKVLHLVFNRAD